MSLYENLMKEVNNGLIGRNGSIPFPVAKLDNYLEIAKNTNYLLVGDTGSGKCFSKGTKLLMYDGSLKEVQDIVVGDEVMGINSEKRVVLETHCGVDDMYKIDQNKGESYTVNGKHILCLRKRRNKTNEYLNISVEDYLKKRKYIQEEWKGYKSEGIEFKSQEVEIDPYFLGLWIGDGTACKRQITTMDKEIVDYLEVFAKKNNLILKKSKSKYGYDLVSDKNLERSFPNGDKEYYTSVQEAAKKLNTYDKHISNAIGKPTWNSMQSKWNWIVKDSSLMLFFRKYNLECNKYIPQHFLINSRENRLKLLAGLLDSDGHYQVTKNCYELTMKSKEIIHQIAFLSRSLGLYTSINPKTAVLKRKGKEDYTCQVYRIFIFGEKLGEIPCILPRKKAKNTPDKVINPLSTGIKVNPIGKGGYFGFSLDGDGLFLLEDFTVVHNSSAAQDLILNTLDWYFDNKTDDLKLSIIYFGMERKLYMYSAKWVSRMIFLKEGILIPVKKILGRRRLNGQIDNLTSTELELVERYAKVFEDWEKDDVFICKEGTHNPTGLKIFIDKFAEKHGKIGEREKDDVLGKKTYEPNHSNHIVLVVTDYVGVLDAEKDENGQKKLRLDKFSWIMRRARDLYGFSPINIQQLSRAVNDYTRLKLNDVKPKLSDIADTSELARDADVVIAIFEPWRYLPQDTTVDLLGYNLTNLRDQNGYKYYRSLHILKSSFDGDGITIGAAFHPMTGILKAMPKKPHEMTDADYKDITNGDYFLKT